MTILINDLSTVYQQLQQFAGSEDFWVKFDRVFGSEYNFTLAENIKTQWLNQDFSNLPTIEILNNDILGNARGGYALSTNTIYLSDSFFANASDDAVNAVILEEIGHFIDTQINEIDTVGDEGELFSTLLTGQYLSVQTLNRISTENDFSMIVLNGETLTIEQSAPSTFSNTANITIPVDSTVNTSPSNPYPSSIVVSGFDGNISSVQVTLNNLSHTFPDDIDILLVSPTGVKMILMSDTGGNPDISGVTLTFSDSAASSLPDATQITTGTYKPTNSSPSDTFPASAPSGPYLSTLGAFNGTDPNGTWQLYIVDDTLEDSGTMTGGWSIAITTAPANQAPTDLILSSNTITENVVVGAGVKIGDITITDPDASGNNNVLIVNDTTNFAIQNGTELFFIGASPNFEIKSTYDITITSTDANGGNPLIYSEPFTVNVNNVNEAPILTVPGSQSIDEDTPITITGISLADVDAGSSDVVVTLSAVSGILTLGSTSGLTSVTGNGASNVTFSGNLTNINSALNLNNLTYQGNANFSGSEIISLSVNDQGNTGSGGALTDSESITVTVNPINDSPTVANVIPNQTATEYNLFDFSFDVNTFNDVDQGDSLTYNATLDDGNALPSWLSFDCNSRTFSGTPSPSDITTIPFSVKVTATDTGTLFVSDTFELTVSALTTTNTTGSGIADNLMGITNTKNNISGAGGNDTLMGGDFADTLLGGSGNDSIIGGNFADILDGGSGNDTLTGGDANDILTAGSGNDILTGGNGNDTLTGGSGIDSFFFNSPSEDIDRITDFSVVDDSIVLSGSGFSLSTGTLMANQFRSGAGITSANSGTQRLIYNSSNGAFYYDADGVGGTTEVQVATLKGGLALTNNDVIVI
ncbi:putative Ig domain-containing protein [Geminocystis sp. NIES-3709]|uniref:putative Ig domain-containing protein n=1 Tax=Geminocystis sp. NIES-3709 TaxID=1617448 RepID=UPI0005FC4DB5|nr:putative Ig domain-containing protein [Geminocystis sp. NIES-3709]BAQ64882.1 alkaline phosphatase [Geminocystis sp. NIES-3709]